MMKSEEIALLRAVAAKLGPNSYCGPWLASVADEVERDIHSDFFPLMSIASTKLTCDKMLEFARSTAADIEAAARTNADKAIRATEDRIAALMERTRSDLNAAIRRLEGWL